ncbi:competence type IV pilus minor pilin ComGF [Psychrobacillus vulpis]|uniref:Competence protein ComGF n=1 Tax=Psychrobacillus vulpis TaxID=2325572 RepID=A0A544TQ26_9BACI|nr:competence type IV pilus minor pilin ComGF [Psychrobacillus vulpis]TQR19558.1 hypothetical protein FG384_11540 [Psychrobacillus vulpis]
MLNNFVCKRLSERGYTLLEGIIQLSVLMLFTQVFAITIGWLHRMEENVTNPTDIEWALFVHDVETYLNNVEVLTLQSDMGIRFLKDGEEFDIEFYQDLIRKQKNRMGHEQMLLHVKSLLTNFDGQSLKFSVEFMNGIKKEHTFYVAFHSE